MNHKFAAALRPIILTCCLLAAGGVAQAKHGPYAYMSTGDFDFGIINLGTGQFTLCGNSGVLLAGLGVGAQGAIYGGQEYTASLYTVNPSNGAVTLIGTSPNAISYLVFGSTKNGVLYALDSVADLYTINPQTAVATRIGATGVPLNGGYYGMSAGAKKLYVSSDIGFYVINTKTGAATLIGTGPTQFGAIVGIGSKLFGGADKPTP